MNNYTASGGRSRVLNSVPPNRAVDRRGAAYLSQQPPLCLHFPPLPNLISPLGWYSASWSLALTSTDTHVVNIRKWLIEHRHYSLPRGIRSQEVSMKGGGEKEQGAKEGEPQTFGLFSHPAKENVGLS
ncbi:hypothetical protein AOLI_G00084660 [Acnodon oligacanthus]